MGYKFKDLFHHEKNSKLYFIVLLFFLAAVTVYALYFDILIPGLPGGSYRKAVGSLFIIPSALLAFGQIFISGFFLHMISAALTKKSDFLKAMAITSAMTLMFSLTYVWLPFYGPFYYIVGFVMNDPGYVLPIEIAYTAFMVVVSSYLIRSVYRMEPKTSVFVAMTILLGITVAAS